MNPPEPPLVTLRKLRESAEDAGWSFYERVAGKDYGFPPEGAADPQPMPYETPVPPEPPARWGVALLIGLGLFMAIACAVALLTAGLFFATAAASFALAARQPV